MRNKQSMKQVGIWAIIPLNLGVLKSSTLFLKLLNTETMVPVFIEQADSQSLLKALHKTRVPNRPLVHRVLLSLMKDVGLSLLRAEIFDIHDDILLARLLFEGQSYSTEKPLVSLVTPCDACILATLAERPICVAENVIEQIGIPVDIELDKFRI